MILGPALGADQLSDAGQSYHLLYSAAEAHCVHGERLASRPSGVSLCWLQ
jgi:hypothetical protein